MRSASRHGVEPNVVVVDDPDAVRRQAVPFGRRAWSAIIVLAGMVTLLATGLVPPAIAALAAAAAMVLLRVVTVPQAHRSISWTTLILVAGMIPLSTAIQVSGTADLIADGIVAVLGSASPYLLVLGISVVTVVLGQLISNMATALILAPIAVAIAAETGISPLPLLMAVAVSAAAASSPPSPPPPTPWCWGRAATASATTGGSGCRSSGLFLLVATFVVPFFWPF